MREEDIKAHWRQDEERSQMSITQVRRKAEAFQKGARRGDLIADGYFVYATSIVLALSFAAARQRVNGRLAVFDIND
jgi:hypothetical protein